MALNILVAGSTPNTRQCAEALLTRSEFKLTGVLTPSPKPIGRKQLVTPNPLDEFAREHRLPVVYLDTIIDDSVRAQISKLPCDILLVVDFGYLVPLWLLEFPKVGPVNIHPSALPRYRGSSPGQFALIFGETESAVTFIRMDLKLDHGPILSQTFFAIEPGWTATDYYRHAFLLTGKELPAVLGEFAKHPKTGSPQPDVSPTVTARMLSREDGFIPYECLTTILDGKTPKQSPTFLQSYGLAPTPENLFNLWRGLTPWPGLWTQLPGAEGKRIKLLQLSFDNDKLTLDTIQLSGKTPTKNIGII